MPTKEIIHRVIKVEIVRNSHPFQLLLLALNPYTPCLVPPPPSLLWYLNHPRLAMVRDYRGTCCSIHIITRPWWQNKIADSFLLWFPLPIFSLNSIILCAAPKTDLQTSPSERASVYFHRNRLFVDVGILLRIIPTSRYGCVECGSLARGSNWTEGVFVGTRKQLLGTNIDHPS